MFSKSEEKVNFLYRSGTAFITTATLAYFESGTFTPNFTAESLERESGWGQLEFSAFNSKSSRPSASTTQAPESPNRIVVAKRIGDYVISCHGNGPASSDPELWVVIMCLDPTANEAAWPSGLVVVGLGDGMVRQFPEASLIAELAAQNQLRLRHGLQPLPDPRTVTDVVISNVNQE
jgi:hypothetical protein